MKKEPSPEQTVVSPERDKIEEIRESTSRSATSTPSESSSKESNCLFSFKGERIIPIEASYRKNFFYNFFIFGVFLPFYIKFQLIKNT